MSSWLRRHKLDVLLVTLLVIVSGLVSGINMTSYPQRFEDEGTYVSQAWAVKEKGAMAHYTYWYDHPPVGWIQMAVHLELTDALDRYGSAITAGREFMLLLHLATVVLLYALARRLKIGRIGSTLAVLVFALSPLAVEFSRYVMLDNVALPWVLGAFLLALSPRRNLTAAVGSAVCMAMAILSKETFAALMPVLLYALWTNSDKRNRRYTFTAFAVVFAMVCGSYALYALLKNELFPGAGHVSLLGTLLWQLGGRQASGSILDATSGSRGLLMYWLNIDYWLLAAGIVALIPALIYRNLRLAGFSLLIGIGLMLRNGYLPYPYIIALLPFAALCFGGVFDRWVVRPIARGRGLSLARLGAANLFMIIFWIALLVVLPVWQSKLYALTRLDQDNSSRQAVAWIEKNIPKDKRMVVESALWTDLQDKGFNRPSPVWLYKTETDPAVTAEINGWKGIDYVVLNGPTVGSTTFEEAFPTSHQAIEHGRLVAEFGSSNQKILIYQVKH